jgi:hypothetical protein
MIKSFTQKSNRNCHALVRLMAPGEQRVFFSKNPKRIDNTFRTVHRLEQSVLEPGWI